MTENCTMWVRTLINLFLTGANVSLLIYMQKGWKKMYYQALERAEWSYTKMKEMQTDFEKLMKQNHFLQKEHKRIVKSLEGKDDDLPRLDI